MSPRLAMFDLINAFKWDRLKRSNGNIVINANPRVDTWVDPYKNERRGASRPFLMQETELAKQPDGR